MITIRAPAKINLTLEVLGRRSDGYHDIVSLMQTIDLSDTLFLTPDSRLSLNCVSRELSNEDNLVLKAAWMLRERANVKKGVHIELIKTLCK